MKFDTPQRIAGGIALVSIAYFTAHTMSRNREGLSKEPSSAPPTPATVYLQNSPPDFSVSLEEVSVLQHPSHDGYQSLSVIATARLINHGGPSAIREYRLDYVTPDGKHIGPFRPVVLMKPVTLGDSETVTLVPGTPNTLTLTPEDTLYSKTLKPIERGEMVFGRLLFNLSLPVVKNPTLKGIKYVLYVKDVEGKESSSELALVDPNMIGPPSPYPGVKPLAE